MNELRATLLVIVSSLVLMAGALLGLAAAGANEATLLLAVIVPLCVCSYGISWVVMHYGESGRRQR